MKLIYDSRYNIAYIQLQKRKAPVRTVRVSDDIYVDLSSKGTLHGIELLNAKQQLKIKKAKG